MTASHHRLAEAAGRELGVEIADLSSIPGGDTAASFRGELRDGRSVFVKHYPNPTPTGTPSSIAHGAVGRFDAEQRGLDLLRRTGTVAVPDVLAWSDQSPSFLVLPWVDRHQPAADHDEQLGRSLAALHRAPSANVGLDHHNWIGAVRQDNTPRPAWPEFFTHSRLLPLFDAAVSVGAIDPTHRPLLGRVIDRLPELCGPPEAPALLHGDLWSGNVIVDRGGNPVLIDPAVYGGHREIDLAMMRLFGGFSSRVFEAYAEAFPLADGHAERVALYQLPPLLVHTILFGYGYGQQAVNALRRYC